MINFRDIDNEDFVFINKPFSAEESRAFSEFLRNRRQPTFSSKRAKLAYA